jgi:hypothetical protein
MTQNPEASTDLTRLTVNLVPAATDALDRCTSRERLSKTDVINRALQVYDFVTARQALGNELLFRLPDSTTEAIHII